MIILDSVTKKFGAFAAVDNVSYTIQKGEFFALLGPNGAGKTTNSAGLRLVGWGVGVQRSLGCRDDGSLLVVVENLM